ncbi:hypothetical protein DOY81_010160 [Sarcophaga bullata]|nr:hypothetical protein DOY81_010160 [Sarcophaga bullata]
MTFSLSNAYELDAKKEIIIQKLLTNEMVYCARSHMEINKIFVLLLLLWTTVTTCSFIRTKQLNNNASAAGTTSNRIKATTSNKSATLVALPTYVWGYTTKYATVLYDEDIIVKGLNVLDIKYPENFDSNNMTIICIYASDKLIRLQKHY